MPQHGAKVGSQEAQTSQKQQFSLGFSYILQGSRFGQKVLQNDDQGAQRVVKVVPSEPQVVQTGAQKTFRATIWASFWCLFGDLEGSSSIKGT